MPEFRVDMFLFGCLGGILPDVLRIIKNRNRLKTLKCFHHFGYWFSLVLLALLGGATVYILNATTLKEAVAIGFAAPEIISKLAAKQAELARTPETEAEADRSPETKAATAPPEEFKVRKWWAS